LRQVDDRLGFSTFVGREISALPGLLQSVRRHFDDIVVVCTNSLPDDGTWAYLRELEHQWYPLLRPYRLAVPLEAGAFDFGYLRSTAAHLNTCGYVFMLDADERVTDEHLTSLKGIHGMALDRDVQVLAFRRHHWYDGPQVRRAENKAAWPDWQPRMIRNNGNIWWRRPVHETALYGPTGVWHNTIGIGDIVIHHHHDWFHPDKDLPAHKSVLYKELAASDPEWTLSFEKEMLPADESVKREIRALYVSLLGRQPTMDEVQMWASSPKDLQAIKDEIRESEEHQVHATAQ
jgi:hypothetical protein